MRHYQPNRTEVFKQGATAFLVIAGALVAFCSGGLLLLFGLANMAGGSRAEVPGLGFGLVLGLTMIVVGAAYGMWSAATERSGIRATKQVKVVARYAFNREGLMLVSEWEIEACDRPRYYVRLDFGYPAGTLECECSEQVYYQCGEGMTGIADLQGKWIGSFVPHTGAAYQTEHIQLTDQQYLFPDQPSGHDRDQPT